MKYLIFILLLACINISAQEITITSNTVCKGDPTSLTASVSIHDSLVSDYLWDLDFDGYFDDAAGREIQYTFPGADTFLVKLQVNLKDGSSILSDDHQAIIHAYPEAGFAES